MIISMVDNFHGGNGVSLLNVAPDHFGRVAGKLEKLPCIDDLLTAIVMVSVWYPFLNQIERP